VGRGVVVREHDECRQKRVTGHAGAFKCWCFLFVLQIGAFVRTCMCMRALLECTAVYTYKIASKHAHVLAADVVSKRVGVCIVCPWHIDS